MQYRIYPLGDQGLCIDWGNRIDKRNNKNVLALFEQFKQRKLKGVHALIPAYSSLSILFDNHYLLHQNGAQTPFEQICAQVEKILDTPIDQVLPNNRLLEVPMCYHSDFAPDLEMLAAHNGLQPQDVVDIHCADEYRVYMLGFLPGFPYMGIVDKRIATPRLEQPRNRVPAGSVGIAGAQTGIYPMESPGGWNIIGRTPLRLFAPEQAHPAHFQPGDRVRFIPISVEEFHQKKMKR